MITQIRKRQLGVLGHILRGNGLGRDCLLGMVEGRRASGRQRTKFVYGIVEVVGCETIVGVLKLDEDRRAWRSIVTNINVDIALR